MPFFSIIIPCYNRADFLPATIKSVLNQSFGDLELLVIDDGSTDGTANVIKELQLHDSRIIYHHKENEERGAARNYGIKKSKGLYLVFLDSDDEFKTNHLSVLNKAILENPKINFFATKFDFYENGKNFKAPISNLEAKLYDYQVLIKGNPFACNVCVKKENPQLILFNNDRKYAIMEDWMFLFANTWSQDLLLIEEYTVKMNEHPNRSMRFNLLIIEKRKIASEFIQLNFGLYKNEKKKLAGYTSYFCAIHNYLEDRKKETLKNILSAFKNLGFRKDLFSMTIKVFLGRKTIHKIKDVINHK